MHPKINSRLDGRFYSIDSCCGPARPPAFVISQLPFSSPLFAVIHHGERRKKKRRDDANADIFLLFLFALRPFFQGCQINHVGTEDEWHSQIDKF